MPQESKIPHPARDPHLCQGSPTQFTPMGVSQITQIATKDHSHRTEQGKNKLPPEQKIIRNKHHNSPCQQSRITSCLTQEGSPAGHPFPFSSRHSNFYLFFIFIFEVYSPTMAARALSDYVSRSKVHENRPQ